MKNLIYLMLMLVSGILTAQTTEQANIIHSGAKPIIQWDKTQHNFGKIPQGKPVSITFEFTNTGNGPLIIAAVNPSCGCTTHDFSKNSIAPGKRGFITLTYNAAVSGNFTKSVSVNTNAESSPSILYFNGEVKAEAEITQ